MNTLEDRLRAATRAAAGTVADDSAPPLRLPQPGHRPRWSAWGSHKRLIVPLAAAAAVIAVISGSILVAGSRPLARPSPVTVSGLPAYFLETPFLEPVALPVRTVNPPIPSQGRSNDTVRVVATATGKVVATATLPGNVTAIAASRDAFFAAVRSGNLARFYEIRLTAGYAGTTVTELPIPPVPPGAAPVAFMAASPNGAELAYATELTGGDLGGRNLVVASTTDGSERVWTTPARDSQGYLDQMNWLADGRTLAFNWIASIASSAEVSLHLLDTAAPGSDLLAGRAVLPSVYAAQAFNNDTTLSPNGHVVVGVANGYRVSESPQGSVVAFSTATGEPTVLFRASTSGDHKSICYSPPVWVSNTGQEVLVSCALEVKATPPVAYMQYIVLIDHGHIAKLPWLDADPQWAMAFPAATAGGMPAHRGG
jgi:hypothetical protein